MNTNKVYSSASDRTSAGCDSQANLSSGHGARNLGAFVVGLAVGGFGAVLLAKQSGAATRENIRNLAEGATEKLRSGVNAVKEQQREGKQMLADVADKARQNYEGAKNAVESVVDKGKELTHTAGRKVEEAGKTMEETGQRMQNI